MASPDLFDTLWSIEKGVKASILLHDWSALDPVIPEINFGIYFHPSHCPICDKILKMSEVELTALVSTDDHYAFLQPCKKKLLNHVKRHHPEIVFWPCVEAPTMVKGDMITYHFMTQKLLYSATKKYSLKELKNFKEYLGVFGSGVWHCHCERLLLWN